VLWIQGIVLISATVGGIGAIYLVAKGMDDDLNKRWHEIGHPTVERASTTPDHAQSGRIGTDSSDN
jgi:hypothetical protein